MSTPNERQKQSFTMTEEQFRKITMERFEEGKSQFKEIKTDVATLAGKVSILTDHIETLTTAMSENTELTKKTAELAQRTANDTSDLVALARFGRKVGLFGRITAKFVSGLTRLASQLSKLLIPIFLVIAILTLWWQGKPINWKDVIEIMTK